MIKTRRFHIAAVALIIVLGVLVYGNSLNNDFVYDDDLVVKDRGFLSSWSNVRHFFDKSYFFGSGELSYRPVITLTYFIDYSLWGTDPFGYHLTNLVLHVFNGILLYFSLLYAIPYIAGDRNNVLPLLASLFFISHPVQTEAVDSVAFRPELLYTTFILLSLFLYFKASSLSGIKRRCVYFLSLIGYFLSLLSKEAALIVIPLILMMDIVMHFKKRLGSTLVDIFRKRVMIYGGFALVSALYGFIRFSWMAAPAAGHKMVSLETIFNHDIWSRLMTSVYVFARYLKLLIFPLDLTSEYVIDLSGSIFEPLVLSSLFILAGVLVLILYGFRDFRLLSFSGLWFFISLMPASNLIPLHHVMAERYLYLPSIGFCLFLAAAGVKLSHFLNKRNFKPANKILGAMAVLVLCLYSFRTITQNKMWSSEKAFWTTIINKPGPHTARSYTNLGIVWLEEGRLERAIKNFDQALKVNPSYIQAYNNLGLVYYKRADYGMAIENYRKILDRGAYLTDFDFIKVYSNLGVTYLMKNMPDKAIEYYRKALELNPYLAEVYFNMGRAYLAKDMTGKAVEYYRKSLELNPDLVKPYYALGMVFLEKGLYEKAIEQFERSVRLSSDFAPGYYGLSLGYYHLRDHIMARKYLNECERLGLDVPEGFIHNLYSLEVEKAGKMKKLLPKHK
ncbi:MAG: hypothetical protein DRP85_04320 [Candidatus Makaraimicrobium thalassicum]|nr:MAG: hypothetical protein DRP85_04320 [Candidatus Omnitrophota bacterium]